MFVQRKKKQHLSYYHESQNKSAILLISKTNPDHLIFLVMSMFMNYIVFCGQVQCFLCKSSFSFYSKYIYFHLHSFKLIDTLSCISLTNLSKCFVFIPSFFQITFVEKIFVCQLSGISSNI